MSVYSSLSDPDKIRMVNMMRKYGDGFIHALAECFLYVNTDQTFRLCMAFPELVVQYLNMAEREGREERKDE